MDYLRMKRSEFVQYVKNDLNLEELCYDKEKIARSHSFLIDFSKDKIIYGINTGFGPMAQYKIDEDKLLQLQYNLIRSHSNGHGEPLTFELARALMLARFNSLQLGYSGISIGVLDSLKSFLENDIHPYIPKHGGVGASGDLVQLAHLALNLIGEGYCIENGEKVNTSEVLQRKGITPLELQLRDGLALINGTSCMTGIAAMNVYYANRLVDYSIKISSVLNEITDSYGDSFSLELNQVKLHPGQQEVAEKMRNFLKDSKLLKSRKDVLYSSSEESDRDQFKNKVQEYYSLRCVPQIIGAILDTVKYTDRVVENELNSVSDNPIVDVENENVYHGGNFHGDYIAQEMDKLKIAITKLSILMERQINYLMNSKVNEKFKPFLNSGTLGLNFGLQGMQFAATSTTAENQTLSNPMSIHTIPCNNDNQDIVSMGTNAALITRHVIENAFEVLSVLLVSINKASKEFNDDDLSSTAKELRDLTDFINLMDSEDKPYFIELERLKDQLKG